MGFFNLKNGSLTDHRDTGDLILKLARSVGIAAPPNEWTEFKADPKAWLHKAGYRYDGPGAGPDGEIPATVNIVPVYDTATTMHVRVPFKDKLTPTPVVKDESYGSGASDDARFKVLLARYFMRQCR